MTKYRIVPYVGNSRYWKVQKKSGWFWSYVEEDIGFGFTEDIAFETEREAEIWIDKDIFERALNESHLSIPPREYP